MYSWGAYVRSTLVELGHPGSLQKANIWRKREREYIIHGVTAVELGYPSDLKKEGIYCLRIGEITGNQSLLLKNNSTEFSFNVPSLRDVWYSTSTALDQHQTSNNLAIDRFENYKNQALSYKFPTGFLGKIPALAGQNKIKSNKLNN